MRHAFNFFVFAVLKCLRLSADPVTLKIKRGKAHFKVFTQPHTVYQMAHAIFNLIVKKNNLSLRTAFRNYTRKKLSI